MFSPLGSFDPNAAIAPALVVGAKAYADSLPSCPDGSLVAGYWHWTVGHKGQDFPDYNGAVRIAADGSFHLDSPHDARDNAIGVNENAPASHTWLRNTGAFGFATDDMVFGDEHDFGPEPLTIATLWWLCAGTAAVSKKYGIDLNGTIQSSRYSSGRYNGEKTWKTHSEAAVRGGRPPDPNWYNYGPSGTVERWDLSSFVALPSGIVVTDAMATICGDALRLASHRIKLLV
jgi:hypothetical protein